MDRKAWIVITLCVIGLVLNGYYMVTRPPAPAPQTPPAAASTPSPTPAATTAPGTLPDAAPAAPGAPATTPVTQNVEVKTARLKGANVEYEFSSLGGGIHRVILLDTKDRIVLNVLGKATIGALSNGARNYSDVNYELAEETPERVVFQAETPEKILIRKEYTFSKNTAGRDHLLDLKITITNRTGAKLVRDSWFLYTGAAAELRPGETERPAFIWNDAGDATAIHTSHFRDGPNWLGWGGPILEEHRTLARTRWAGVMSRFYSTVITTKEDSASRLWMERFLFEHKADASKGIEKSATDHAIHGGMSLPPVELEPDATRTLEYRIYNGPKIYRDLAAIDTADGNNSRQMNQVMFYGNWFGWVSRILINALRVFHDWTGNWGVAIIMLTVAVRSLLWPLQARSNAQMKKMGKLSPMVKELQEKYKDEPQKVQVEMMKLYKEYGVNPLGGCLPLLIQFPIFIGFFTVLKYATELRGEPFIWWVKDLSLPDTVATLNLGLFNLHVNPLPLLMGLTMFLQMKLTPQPATVDKMQQRIFMVMPFLFLWFCYDFASALALYWTFTNIFMIFQAQLTRIWQKEPVLERKAVVDSKPSSVMAYGAANKPKKDKPNTLRPGGGGSKSTRKRNP